MDTYDFGDPVTLDLQVRDAAGVLVTPTTITLTTRDPDGAETTVVPATTGVGLYSVTLLPTVAGTWLYRWETTGPGEGAEEGGFTVAGRFTATGAPWAPSPEEVRNELPGRQVHMAKIPDDVIGGLIANRAASLQGELPTPLPDSLHPVARNYLIYSVAAILEDRFFPEQSSLNGSNAERLDQRAGAELARLRTALAAAAASTTTTHDLAGSFSLSRW